MSTQPKLVSVIVPTNDRPGFLREALASIRALETDTLKFEILVGDNGSNPETKIVVDQAGATYLKVERRGAGAARNAGLKVAKGEYIAFLDDDDVWLPTNVTPHIAMLEQDPELEGVFGQIITTNMDLKPMGDAWPVKPGVGDELVEAMLSGYYPQLGGTLVRASVRDKVGLFDESLLGDQDWDWQLRVARRRKVGFTETHCALFRQRPPGSFDKLRLMRLGFARRVFFRHSLPEWRVWKNPLSFMKSYTLTVRQYFDYFVDAAITRAATGERKGIAGALMGAFRVFPARTVFHVIMRRPLRTAAWVMIWPGGTTAISERPDMSERIDIAFGFDGRYVPHAANVMVSIVRHAPGAKLRFIVLQSDVTPEQKKRIEAAAKGPEFVWIDVGDDDLPAYATRGHLNRTVLFRLGLETLAPADCKRILYIDADTIVLGDVRELWAADLGSHAIGAVTDCYQEADKFAELWDLPKGGRYFNAGVQVIDLEKVRAGKLFSKALDFIVEHDAKLLFGDQDALNYTFWKNSAAIEPTWNVQRFVTRKEITGESAPDKRWGHSSPRLIHFIGLDKPWLRNAWHPWAWTYWESLRRTSFAKDVKTASNVDFLQMMRFRLRWWLRRPGPGAMA